MVPGDGGPYVFIKTRAIAHPAPCLFLAAAGLCPCTPRWALGGSAGSGLAGFGGALLDGRGLGSQCLSWGHAWWAVGWHRRGPEQGAGPTAGDAMPAPPVSVAGAAEAEPGVGACWHRDSGALSPAPRRWHQGPGAHSWVCHTATRTGARARVPGQCPPSHPSTAALGQGLAWLMGPMGAPVLPPALGSPTWATGASLGTSLCSDTVGRRGQHQSYTGLY